MERGFQTAYWTYTTDLLGVADAEGVLRDTNPAWLTVLGYSTEEIESRPFMEFIHADDLGRTITAFEAMQDDQNVLNFENRYRHADGSYRWLSWNSVSDQGVFVFSARDITNAKRDHADLGDSQRESKLRDQFVAVLGHDLRNPVASILSAVRILRRRSDSPQNTDMLEGIDRAAWRMSAMIDDILDFARGRLGSGMILDKQDVTNFSIRLERIVDELRVANPDAKIHTMWDGPSTIHCDPERIEQFLSNIVANALTHGHSKAPIHVTSAVDGAHVRLDIVNTGEPIPDALQANLFKPFERRDISAKNDGLGLGLYISKMIADAHDGTLDVISNATETRFTLRFPIATD